MKRHRLVIVFFAASVALALALRTIPAQEQQAEAGQEALTRGPLHEAFAQPIVFDPKPGPVIKQQPPKAVEELPPEQRMEGEDVQWIGGYWAWDEDRDDFIWVSGIWRNIPPGLEWTPGYWAQTSDGWQWVGGFWTKANEQQIEYLPEPPETLEEGPSSEAPSVNHIWAPGCWTWHQTRYVWRPGHWIVDHPGWIWVPACYRWTPPGWVHIQGFWDYSFRRRGVCFAPIHFHRAAFARPRFIYSPSIVIDVNVVTDHLFVRPHYCHYVFGDYYAANYLNVGVYPWFSFHLSRHGYDPIFAYYRRHYHSHDRDWTTRLRHQYQFFRENERFRPARTVVNQTTVVNNVQQNVNVQQNINVNSLVLAKPLREVAENRENRFERIDEQRRQQAAQRQQQLAEQRQKRAELEARQQAQQADQSKEGARPKPIRVDKPSSPIVGAARPQRGEQPPTPPQTPTTAAPDSDTKPRPKRGEGLPRPESQLDPAKQGKRPDPDTPKPGAKKPQPPVDPPVKDDPPKKPRPPVDPPVKDDPPKKPRPPVDPPVKDDPPKKPRPPVDPPVKDDPPKKPRPPIVPPVKDDDPPRKPRPVDPPPKADPPIKPRPPVDPPPKAGPPPKPRPPADPPPKADPPSKPRPPANPPPKGGAPSKPPDKKKPPDMDKNA